MAKSLGEDFALVTYTAYVIAADSAETKALRSLIWQCDADGNRRMLFHQVRDLNDQAALYTL